MNTLFELAGNAVTPQATVNPDFSMLKHARELNAAAEKGKRKLGDEVVGKRKQNK